MHKRIYLSLPLFIIVAPKLGFGQTGDIRAHCEEEWPTDFEMQEYCIEKQSEGASELSDFLQSYDVNNSNLEEKVRANDPAAVIVSECMTQWDDDYEMIAYCVSRQSEAAERLGRLSPPADTGASRAGADYDYINSYRQRYGDNDTYESCESRSGRTAHSENKTRLSVLRECLQQQGSPSTDTVASRARADFDYINRYRQQYADDDVYRACERRSVQTAHSENRSRLSPLRECLQQQ